MISVVSTSALVVIGQCNSFDVVENHNCVSAKQNKGGNLEPFAADESRDTKTSWWDARDALEQDKGNYHFELWEPICFSCLFEYQQDVFVPHVTDRLQTVYLLHSILFFGSLICLYWLTRFIAILNVLVFKMPRMKLQVCASRSKWFLAKVLKQRFHLNGHAMEIALSSISTCIKHFFNDYGSERVSKG